MTHPLEYETIILVAVMPDDSASIAGDNRLWRDNTQDVIDGHNAIIDLLRKSRDAPRILFKTQLLNSETALNNWVPLEEVVPLTKDNFKPSGTTPLYDKTISLLADVIYQRTEALKRGQQARWAILLITDGDDNASKTPASEVKRVLDDMRQKEDIAPSCEPDNEHAGSIALLGVDDRERPDPKGEVYFEKIAHSIGIEWVLHSDRTRPTHIRRAFNIFSSQAVSSMP